MLQQVPRPTVFCFWRRSVDIMLSTKEMKEKQNLETHPSCTEFKN